MGDHLGPNVSSDQRRPGDRLQSPAAATMATIDHFNRWPVEAGAALIGAGVGLLAWFLPDLVGGGDPINRRTLVGTGTLAALPLIFFAEARTGRRILFGRDTRRPICPNAGARRTIRVVFRTGCQFAFPKPASSAGRFVVVGMAVLFTGVVRSPLTGIVLVTEMTADVHHAVADARRVHDGHADADFA